MNLVEIKTSTSSLENADFLSKLIMEAKLASAINISEIKSSHFYNGEIRCALGYCLVMTSSEENFKDIGDILRKHHEYKAPALYSLPMSNLSKNYEKWIIDHSISVLYRKFHGISGY